jgi:broad specificity phosphatase PhoE
VFASVLGTPLQVVEELSELDHGAWSGLTADEVEANWPGQGEARARDKYEYRFPGGESYADADVRAKRALDRVYRSGAQVPLVVSHEIIGRMLLKNLAGLGSEQALMLHHPSDVVYRVQPPLGAIDVLPNVVPPTDRP